MDPTTFDTTPDRAEADDGDRRRFALPFRPTLLHRALAALPATCLLLTVALGYTACLRRFTGTF
jgi:hypothetical protein